MILWAYTVKLRNEVVSNWEYLQAQESIKVVNNWDSIVEQTQVLEIDQFIKSPNLLNIVKWKVWKEEIILKV